MSKGDDDINTYVPSLYNPKSVKIGTYNCSVAMTQRSEFIRRLGKNKLKIKKENEGKENIKPLDYFKINYCVSKKISKVPSYFDNEKKKTCTCRNVFKEFDYDSFEENISLENIKPLNKPKKNCVFKKVSRDTNFDNEKKETYTITSKVFNEFDYDSFEENESKKNIVPQNDTKKQEALSLISDNTATNEPKLVNSILSRNKNKVKHPKKYFYGKISEVPYYKISGNKKKKSFTTSKDFNEFHYNSFKSKENNNQTSIIINKKINNINEHSIVNTNCDNLGDVESDSAIEDLSANYDESSTSSCKNNTLTIVDGLIVSDIEIEIVEITEHSIQNNKEYKKYNEEEKETKVLKTTKRSVVYINLDVKRSNMSDPFNDSRVLCLKTDAIDQLSHVIVQPPNYKLVKRQISKNRSHPYKYSKKQCISKLYTDGKDCVVRSGDVDGYTSKCDVMNRTLDVNDNLKSKKGDSAKSTSLRSDPQKRHESKSPIHTKATLPAKSRREISNSAPLQRKKTNSLEYLTHNHLDGDAFAKIPYHKIIAGTCFAVDAFSYGEIKNVKHYFLTHFHADHYAGLKKSFNKTLLCSKITADLCVSRLGVNSRHIQILVNDETIRLEGSEVTAVEANHCPGAIMLVFSLPNGKTILHTGDFRASYTMESYPIFWNKDIYTVYLDTTYCNPRYDFPSQDESIDMAFNILKEKKKAVEELGKNFNTVLIVCGTYTIGKEKFFMGVARRIGCTVWACSGKDSILQTVEDRSFNKVSALNCQLHVMPMRDITHEKLRSHLDTLKGTFTEVVAFKPSGWENTKKPSVEKDLVTIHGIPYSEHSSFSELVRFVKFLKPRQVVPTVDIPGGIKSVQKHFPCPLVLRADANLSQSKLSEFFKDKHGKPAL